MNDIFEKLTKKKEELDTYRPLPPEQIKNIEDWFKVELTYSSNAIEGNTLSRIETSEVIEKGVSAVISGKQLKDQLEAINHAKALDYVKTFSHERRGHQYITEEDIKTIHKIILTGINDHWAGNYRQAEVFIRGTTVILPPPQKIPYLMKQFIHWLQSEQGIHPVKVAADAHLKFESIHPFMDGNGRVGRLLINLILLVNSYPMAIIRNEERTEYLEALNRAQMQNDLRDWYRLLVSSVERSLDAYLAAAKGKSIIPFFIEKKDLAKNLLQIGKVASLAGVPIPTIRYYLAEGLIKPEEKSKGGFMLFSPKVVEKIKEIKRLQKEERLAIAEIKIRLT